jgi:hypothetical protein
MHRLWKLSPGDELTLERVEMDAQVCRQYPCSTEYYRAQAELSRQWSLHQPGLKPFSRIITDDLPPDRRRSRPPTAPR